MKQSVTSKSGHSQEPVRVPSGKLSSLEAANAGPPARGPFPGWGVCALTRPPRWPGPPSLAAPMRLTFIFVAVLAASVSLTSLAAWGITYGVSSARPGPPSQVIIWGGVAPALGGYGKAPKIQ